MNRSPASHHCSLIVGITYLNEVYDSITNPDNYFFSSPISFYLGLQIALNLRINQQSIIRGEFTYNHISNSGIQMPNKGMNYPTLSIGYEYSFQPLNFQKYPKGLGYLTKKWRLQLTGITYYEIISETNEYPIIKKWVYGVELVTTRSLTNINGLLLGFESYYDRAAAESNTMRDTDFQEVLLNSTFGNILVFGRLSLTQQLCYAIIPLPYNEKPFFQRYAMYFRVKKHIQLGVSLKAHAQVAYQMDVRVGWTF